MKIPQRDRPPGVRFDITPLIDVVFLLVIFFLVTLHFSHSETVEAVELPPAEMIGDDSQSPRRMVVSVMPDGRLFVQGRERAIEEFEELLGEAARGRTADFEVRIRADESAEYGAVEPVLLASLRTGITKLGFAVIEQ